MNSNETDFEDVSKERPSQVWKYFLFNKKTEYGKCKLCPKFKQLKAKGGGSKGLKDHLFLVHKIKIETVAENCQASSPAKKSKISGHFKPSCKMSLETKIARLCTLSGLSFKKLAEDVDIREALKAQGYDIPKNREKIRKLLLSKHNEVMQETKSKNKQKKKKKRKFSLTTDEYTSGANRRYININSHSKGEFYFKKQQK